MFGGITATQEINRIVTEGANTVLSTREFINHEIINFKTSKRYKQMLNGVNYYDGQQDILTKERTVIGENGKPIRVDNLPNSKQVDNQYKKMVKQKTNYLLGKPFSLQTEDDNYADILNTEFFNKKFSRQLKNIGKDSLNCGIGWLYIYYDDMGKFRFKRFRPFEVIPGWTNIEHTDLDYIIRFYEVSVYDGKQEKKVTKVEYYTLEGIQYFEYYNGALLPCEPYETKYFSVGNQSYNWERLPFIPFKYNDEELPLIVNCKSLQDGLNTILSNFQDNMEEDTRNTILVLVNYDGTNLGEFRRNLATYGAVKVNTRDGVSGDVKTLQVAVNAENYKSILEIFKKAIIENCMGYDAKDDKIGGNANQMNIQSMYNDIDLDASDMETEYQAALEDLIYFVNLHLNNTGQGDYMHTPVEIVFNTDMPMDEATTINNIRNSVGILSTDTLVANHPWVVDPQAEVEKLNAEKQEQMEQYAGAFGGNTTEEDNVNE